MSKISTQIKSFEGNDVRIANIKGDFYFCLLDVCKILEIINNRNINSRLDSDGVRSNDEYKLLYVS